MAETFLEKKFPCALPWSQIKYSGNHFRRSCEAARHLKQTHSATETRRSLAGLAGIKASGENTVRSDMQMMLGHVLQLRGHWSGHRLPRVRPICPPPRLGHGPPCSLGLWESPHRSSHGQSHSRGRCCYDHKGLQGALLGPCRNWTLVLLLGVRVGRGSTVTQLDQSLG